MSNLILIAIAINTLVVILMILQIKAEEGRFKFWGRKSWRRLIMHFGIEAIAILMVIYGIMNINAVRPAETECMIGIVFWLVGGTASVTMLALFLTDFYFDCKNEIVKKMKGEES